MINKKERKRKESHPPSVSSPIVRSPVVEWQVKRETADCPQKSELGPPRNWYMHVHTPQWLNREGQPLDCWVFFLSRSLPLRLVSDPSILALFSVFCSPHKDIEERERAEMERERLKTREMPVGSICSVVRYTQAMGRPPLTRSNCQTHTFRLQRERLFAALEASSSQHPISFLPCLISSAPSLKFLRPSALFMCVSVCATCFCSSPIGFAAVVCAWYNGLHAVHLDIWIFVQIRKQCIHEVCVCGDIQDSWIRVTVKISC